MERRGFSGTAAVLGLWSVVVVGPAREAEPALREFAIPSGADASRSPAAPTATSGSRSRGRQGGPHQPGGVVTEFSLPVPAAAPAALRLGRTATLVHRAGRPVLGASPPAGSSPSSRFVTRPGTLAPGLDIVTGADGHLWITHLRPRPPDVDRVSTTGDVETYPCLGTAFAGLPEHITAGGDGAFWVVKAYAARLGGSRPPGRSPRWRCRPATTTTSRPGPRQSRLVGFKQEGSGGRIPRVTPGGGVSDSEVPGSPSAVCLAPSLPLAATNGPQGRLWFLDDARNRVGSITTGGVINTFDLPGHNRGLADITAGSDGNLWFIQNGSHTIGRLAPASVENPSAAIGSAPGPSTTLKTAQPIAAGGSPPGQWARLRGVRRPPAPAMWGAETSSSPLTRRLSPQRTSREERPPPTSGRRSRRLPCRRSGPPITSVRSRFAHRGDCGSGG